MVLGPNVAHCRGTGETQVGGLERTLAFVCAEVRYRHQSPYHFQDTTLTSSYNPPKVVFQHAIGVLLGAEIPPKGCDIEVSKVSKGVMSHQQGERRYPLPLLMVSLSHQCRYQDSPRHPRSSGQGAGSTKCWPSCPEACGAPSGGGKGARAGSGRSSWPCIVGGVPGMGRWERAGCWGSGPPGVSTGSASTTGATCRSLPPWRNWWTMLIAALLLSGSMKRPRGSWAGISTRAGAGQASTATPPQ